MDRLNVDWREGTEKKCISLCDCNQHNQDCKVHLLMIKCASLSIRLLVRESVTTF